MCFWVFNPITSVSNVSIEDWIKNIYGFYFAFVVLKQVDMLLNAFSYKRPFILLLIQVLNIAGHVVETH